MSNLPSAEKRETDRDLKTKAPGGYSTMVQSVRGSARYAAEVLNPANPEQLVLDAGRAETSNSDEVKMEETVIELFNAAPKNSVEKRVLRSVMIASVPRKRIHLLTKEALMEWKHGAISTRRLQGIERWEEAGYSQKDVEELLGTCC